MRRTGAEGGIIALKRDSRRKGPPPQAAAQIKYAHTQNFTFPPQWYGMTMDEESYAGFYLPPADWLPIHSAPESAAGWTAASYSPLFVSFFL